MDEPSQSATPGAASQLAPVSVQSTPAHADRTAPDSAVPVIQPSKEENIRANTTPRDADTTIEVVLLIHGIRDFAEWEHKVSPILKEMPNKEVWALYYGRFDAVRFWFPIWTRDAPVRKLLWRIRAARIESTNAEIVGDRSQFRHLCNR